MPTKVAVFRRSIILLKTHIFIKLDLRTLNRRLRQDLEDLNRGATVELPVFDFKTGIANDSTGKWLTLAPRSVLVRAERGTLAN